MKLSDAVDFNAPALDYARKDFPLLEADASVREGARNHPAGRRRRTRHLLLRGGRRQTIGRRCSDAAFAHRGAGNVAARDHGAASDRVARGSDRSGSVRIFRALQAARVSRGRRGTPNHRRRRFGCFHAKRPRNGRIGKRKPARDDFFEALGFHLAEVRDASPWRAFRYRFPWLLATVASGTACAILAGLFEATLARSLVIAFFLTMVLGLNESVSAQSMSVTIQALRSARVTWRWFVTAFRRELVTALLLGLACGTLVAIIVWLWRHDCAGRVGHRRQHCVVAGHGLLVWAWRSVRSAPIQARSENCRRPDHTRAWPISLRSSSISPAPGSSSDEHRGRHSRAE